MKPRSHPASILRPLLSLLLTSAAVRAGEMPVPVPVEKIPAPVEVKSAGLLNDALREASPAFSEWDIGGQVRFRYELKDDAGSFPQRDFLAGDSFNDNDYFLFRQKLHIGWQPQSWLKFFVEGRGSQTASDDRPMDPERDVADLHQAWIQLGDPKLFPLTLKIGRQEMTYGDQRFIGLGDWGNIPRSFDAVTLRTSFSEKTWIDLFTGRVVIGRDDHFNISNDYDQFSGLYASSQEILSGVETQAFFLARNVGEGSPNAVAAGIGGPTARDVYTYGTRLKSLPGAFGNWDFAFEGAGQFGETGTGAQNRDLEAFTLTGTLGYTFKDAWSKPRVAVGYDYASGDSDAGDDEQNTFEPLFGTNHSLYGVMDLVGLRNLSSPRLSLTMKPTAKLSVSVDYLLFWLADTADSFYPESGGARSQNGYGRHPEYDSFAGSEIDVVAKYAATSWAEIQLGYGHFFPGDYVKESIRSVPSNNGVTGADWVYVQTVINF
ncbi:MAG: alginate export family protein [Verrucomicrobiota bacterium]